MASRVRIFNAETLRYRVKVGRAVHCAPVWVVQARLSGLNLVFRALTGAATLICSAVAVVCDRQLLLARIWRTVLLHPCGGKTDGVRRTPLQK